MNSVTKKEKYMRVGEGSQMSSGLSNIFSFFTWTNSFCILIYLMSLSDFVISNFHSQMSSSSTQRYLEKYATSFSEARASTLQASTPDLVRVRKVTPLIDSITISALKDL